MTLNHVSKVTPLQARPLCCCRNHSGVHKEGMGLWQKIHGSTLLYGPDTKHSLPLDVPASGHNISNDLHRPSGFINHILPIPTSAFKWRPTTWLFLLRSCLFNENLLFQFWHQHCLQNCLCPWRKWVNNINLWSVKFWQGRQELSNRTLKLLGPGGPDCQFSNIWVL